MAAALSQSTYEELKDNARLTYRTKVKSDVQSNVLHGWIKNAEEDAFGLGWSTT